ncbi:hypothetical protein Q8A67_012336 [Cirrhinus molitorella]|uniref:Uncharacterized protein n=1 Tax=Cirrhinus molitorella TaxID=172907 RepID=A0AA88PUE1_9TELE|nr:hypothetical protein Q8A67_012336 [Cirrhinus molitorella]
MSQPCVWVIGSSYIRRLQADLSDQNLGLPCSIVWDGKGGRLWEHLIPTLRSLRARGLITYPSWGLCLEGRNKQDFLWEIKDDLSRVFRMFPRTTVLFSDILPRLNRRGQTGRSAYGIERSRRWLNGAVSGFLSDHHMSCIWHPNIVLTHLIKDGVHLGPEANRLFLTNLREALQEELKRKRFSGRFKLGEELLPEEVGPNKKIIKIVKRAAAEAALNELQSRGLLPEKTNTSSSSTPSKLAPK